MRVKVLFKSWNFLGAQKRSLGTSRWGFGFETFEVFKPKTTTLLTFPLMFRLVLENRLLRFLCLIAKGPQKLLAKDHFLIFVTI